ncbi:uncharacterized protein N7443_010747 [Penicillium atrosanguineum]|uniref:uncharacterized protein n=1 Tax=Penicillium atrosanguineum TaxID=1132637 RepID=UPI00239C61B1|nr:uncharacterized protein N7443_010747 [Penicillium atrosanguineum]KAJ5290494.1 hypothetical protein N7443_010747 [Penicillium atrosanguineum]
MPLHLLGKKSWNVYNPENIARVKRDEAQAQAREEEDERQMQEVDAERRIQILRGERVPTPPPPPVSPESPETSRQDRRSLVDPGRTRIKRRRLAGEDDTDRDIRLAREDAAQAVDKRDELSLASQRERKDTQVPLVDSAGHINLFPERTNKKAEKNPEAQAEAVRKKREFEDQYTMRFSNAAGFKETAGRQPWYSSGGQAATAPDAMSEKNVWGNEDPMRKNREKARMDVNDPLAAMKRGVRQLKTTQQERKRWNGEKRREIEDLKADERQRSRHQRKRSRSRDSFDGFRLDSPASKDRGPDKKEHQSSHCHHRHHHDRSQEHSHRDSSRERSRRRSHRSSDRTHQYRHDEPRSYGRRSNKSELGTAYEKR